MGLFSTKPRPTFKRGRLRVESLESRLLLHGGSHGREAHEVPLPDHGHDEAIVIGRGESRTLMDAYTGQPNHLEAQSPYFADPGDGSHYVWQDQIPGTPDVIDVYYDFRAQGTSRNLITSEQIVMAESALEMWSDATDGRLSFTRSTTVAKNMIINIGTGDLASLGYTSEPGGVLALGGGVYSNKGNSYTISSGVAWLDYAENWDAVFGNGNVAGSFDYFTVVAHEIGHALGLGHVDYLPGADIMDGIYPGELTGPSANDLEHINVLYGAALPATPGILVQPTFGLITSEWGSSDSFSVVLQSAPLADVTMSLHSSDPSEGTLSTSSLTFTPSNWSLPQTVTVYGVDDDVVDDVVDYWVVIDPAVSADPAYNNLDPDDVLVFNLDDDVAVNAPPVAIADSAGTQQSTAVVIDVLGNDTDAEGDALTVTNLTQPSHGVVVLNPDKTITYTPNSGYVGQDVFTYTASDGLATSNVATVTIDVAGNPNDMYVWDIAFESLVTKKGKTSSEDLRASVTVRRDSNANGAADVDDATVSSASVTLSITGGSFNQTYSGTTNDSGVFTTGWISNISTGVVYTAEVTGLTRSGMIWSRFLDPTVNDGDADGDNLPDDSYGTPTSPGQGKSKDGGGPPRAKSSGSIDLPSGLAKSSSLAALSTDTSEQEAERKIRHQVVDELMERLGRLGGKFDDI